MKRIILFIITCLFVTGVVAQVNPIDLGLPSGTLWADRNVGAINIDDIGDYFAWGETQPKNKYEVNNYKFRTKGKIAKQYKKSNLEIGKYVIKQDFSTFKDNNNTLFFEDDAAYQNLGKEWRMPSIEQLKELRTHCKWVKKTNGYKCAGYEITGPNGNTLFLPCTGSFGYYDPRYCKYWSRDVFEDNGIFAWCLTNHYPKDTKTCTDTHIRSVGHTIRAVYIGSVNPPSNNLAKLSYRSVYTTTTSSYLVKVGINSTSVVTDSKVYVNGVLSRRVTPVKNDGFDYTINQEVTLKEGTNDIRVEVTNSAGTSKESYSVTYKRNVVVARPELTWKSPLSATSKDYALWVGVKSSSAISDTKVYHNGQLSRGVLPVKNDGDDYSIKRNIVLTNGENVIRVDVTNESGTISITKTISLNQYTPVPNPQPTPNGNVVVNNQKRLALVIGNSQYTHATKLPNPANDATDISRKLRSLGFDVIEKHDLTSKDFKSAIREFGSKASLYDAW